MKFKTLLCLLLLTSTIYAGLPESRQATIIDASSSAEVVLEATGIYYSQKGWGAKKEIRKYGIDYASKDARKAAVYYLLYSGTDPILSTEEEKRAFLSVEDKFFSSANINKFITYEDAQPRKKVSLKNGKGIRIIKLIKVNKDMIIAELESRKIVMPLEELTETIGNPMIMVIPQTPKGKTPIDILQEDENAKLAAGVVQSYLTAQKYEVILPDQQSFLNDLTNSQIGVAERDEDISYQLALSIGSDVYIDFSVSESDAAYGTQKYAVTVRAYETTTGRLLGTETGHSEARKGEKYVSIEEAMLSAISNVLSRVTNYWEEDLDKGTQYKVIANIQADAFTDQDVEEIQDAFFDAIDSFTEKSKEVVVTRGTIDYLIWVDPKEYDKTRVVWRKIRNEFRDATQKANIAIISQNRKRIIIKIDAI